ncbi:hypothetical protein CALVIDRAFT_602670 [Calocera viscosa TUFC12733]|uniref:DUF6533 domain-containing protein n=1 Tax=Calocera viscosa (strain TUFC12733) TaxID=1330018 RepID=A0A167GPP5_CALVF|nr:hypothetical protein CALVIDRAFT_602670 [Calocera viscosa TUFC12733]
MDNSALAELVQTLGDLRSYHSGTVAALAWLLYDIIVMMDQEIKHIWIGLESLAICINLIQILRVRALFQGNRLVLIPLWFLFFANTAVSVSLSIAVVSTTNLMAAPTFITLDGCLTVVNHAQLMLGPYISSTVYSGVFFLVTLAKLHPYLDAASSKAPLLTVFVRDGTIFFSIIFVVELVSVIWGQVITPIRPSLQDIVNV